MSFKTITFHCKKLRKSKKSSKPGRTILTLERVAKRQIFKRENSKSEDFLILSKISVDIEQIKLL